MTRRARILGGCWILVFWASVQLSVVRAGGCAGMPDMTPCTPDGIDCTLDQCQNQVCVHPPAPPGTACGGIPPECHRNVCDLNGACVLEQLGDGAACFDDGNACTSDVCVGGFCNHPVKPDLTACPDDGNDCTDNYCLSGFCFHPNTPDGGPCSSDGNECSDDVCLNGLCEHNCVPEGTECRVAPGRLGACKVSGTSCSCVDRGRCCLATGCTDLLLDACNLQGGIYQGDGTSCYVQNVAINQTKAILSWTGNGAPTYDLAYARVVPAASFSGNYSTFATPMGGTCVFGCAVPTTSYTIGCKGTPPPTNMDMWLVRDRGGVCTGSWDEAGNQFRSRDVGALGVPASVCP